MGGGQAAAPQLNAQQSAQDQTRSNVATATANAQLGNTNQVTPYGSLSYDKTGGAMIDGNWVPSYTATQTLSPSQQAIYDKTTGLQSQSLDLGKPLLNRVSDTVSTPLDFKDMPAMPADGEAAKSQAYNDLMARFNTDFDRSSAATDTKLRNQGLQPGTEAYNTQMELLNRTKTDAQQQAELNATTLAGQDIQHAQTVRNQAIGEKQTIRNAPLQEYSTLLGLGGGVTSPTYAPPSAGTVAPTDVAGLNLAQYQGQIAQQQMANQSNNATMGGLFGLGGSALMGGAMII